MSYKILIDHKTLKFINKQDHDQKRRIFAAINKLPHTGDVKRLESNTELYRLRVGNYRIVYRVDNGRLVICVIDAGNRGDIYKRYWLKSKRGGDMLLLLLSSCFAVPAALWRAFALGNAEILLWPFTWFVTKNRTDFLSIFIA